MTGSDQDKPQMWSIVRHVSPAHWLVCKAVGSLVPRIYVSAVGGLKLERHAIPDLPGRDWMLCRTRIGGICGTDMGMVFFKHHPATMLQRFICSPVMLGHENVAQIVRTGPDVTHVTPGQRVIVDPPLACRARAIEPLCRACQAGRPSICENMDKGALPATVGLGYNNFTGGTWSEYFVAHVSQIHEIPDSISDEHAVLIDPLACSLHAVLEDVPACDEHVLVFGAGIMGLGCLAMLRALAVKSHVTMTVKYEYQAELALRLGADQVVFWRGGDGRSFRELAELVDARALSGRFGLTFLQGGFDRVYDCTGSPSSFAQAARLVRPRGTLVVVGTPQLGLTDLTCTWFREMKVLGVTGRAVQRMPGKPTAEHNYDQVIELLDHRRIDADAFALRVYPYRDFRTALLDLRNRARERIVKAALDFRW